MLVNYSVLSVEGLKGKSSESEKVYIHWTQWTGMPRKEKLVSEVSETPFQFTGNV